MGEDNYTKWKHREKKSDRDFDKILRAHTVQTKGEIEGLQELVSPKSTLPRQPCAIYRRGTGAPQDAAGRVSYIYHIARSRARLETDKTTDPYRIAMFFLRPFATHIIWWTLCGYGTRTVILCLPFVGLVPYEG